MDAHMHLSMPLDSSNNIGSPIEVEARKVGPMIYQNLGGEREVEGGG
jgi:hypothetical protein